MILNEQASIVSSHMAHGALFITIEISVCHNGVETTVANTQIVLSTLLSPIAFLAHLIRS